MSAVLARCDECGAEVVLVPGDLCVHVGEVMDDTSCNGPLVMLGPAVFVLHLHDHETEDSVTVHETERGAEAHLASICRQAVTFEGRPGIRSDRATIDRYYEEHAEARYTIAPQQVRP